MLAPDSPADARKLRSSGIAGLDESLNAESRRFCPGEPLSTGLLPALKQR
jgi:hypothetical protein